MKLGILVFSAIGIGWLAMSTSYAGSPKGGGQTAGRAAEHGSLGTGFPGAGKWRPGSVGGPTIRGATVNGTHSHHKR